MQKIGAFDTTFIAKICHSPWSSFVFLLSKVLEVRAEFFCIEIVGMLHL
jgi:hypothetical protein